MNDFDFGINFDFTILIFNFVKSMFLFNDFYFIFIATSLWHNLVEVLAHPFFFRNDSLDFYILININTSKFNSKFNYKRKWRMLKKSIQIEFLKLIYYTFIKLLVKNY